MESMKPDIVDDYIQLSGSLFEKVQSSGIFPDSKTFVDSIPKTDPQIILNEFRERKQQSDFDLKAFIQKYFEIPGEAQTSSFEPGATMWTHIDTLWDYLGRRPDEQIPATSTLIPLPHPYIVPGGRFREIYYWDTYFTAEGLAASGRLNTVENLARNFAWLIEKIGHMPNGNRYYYVSRSQPPFFALLVDLIAWYKNEETIQEFLPALEKEYDFWMTGREKIGINEAHRRIVNRNGSLFNRYWDDRPLPREESWREDVETARELETSDPKYCYRQLRAGAESGWDFTSRWFRDGMNLNTIRTTEILPVDLNCLLWFMEKKLVEWTSDNAYQQKANNRRASFDYFFWSNEYGFYFDYDWKSRRQTEIWSMAGVFPLFVGLANQRQADSVARVLESKFLKEGGLAASLHETGQQWDYPNGWAPLQWIAVKGLINYGHEELAETIADRWLLLNESVFDRTHKMMEKYNVCDLSLEAGGGEYPLQDGFGWTNGVAVAMKKLFSK